MSLPEPTATAAHGWTRPPYATEEAARVYRASCVSQAFDRTRAVGQAPVTAPEVLETSGRISVRYGVVRTSSLDLEGRAASVALRSAWTLA